MVEGRNEKGQFIKGHVANPKGRAGGKPGFRQMLFDLTTPAKWKTIVKRAIADASGGDRHARKWLSDYILGKPIDVIDMKVSGGMSLDVWLATAKDRIEQAEEAME